MTTQRKRQPVEAAPQSPPRKTKFQADLVPAEDRMIRALKHDLQLASNSDFLSDALALFRWAAAERRLGRRIVSESPSGDRRVLVFPRLERLAPEADLPRVEIEWTERELESLAKLASAPNAAPPTDLLRKAMRNE